ncbi:DUF378 domain-containing protein [Candidatus Daviesbacteria bacterium]|nr:DUF378 domain-containing protein [Candidatus Daviesbacteria bacterium]
MKTYNAIALVLVVVGALNLGLVGLLDVNIIGTVFGGADSVIYKVVSILIGLGGLLVAWERWGGAKK